MTDKATPCFGIDPRTARELKEHAAEVRSTAGVNYYRIGDGEQCIGAFITVEALNVLLTIAAELDSPKTALGAKFLKMAKAEARGKTLTLEEAFPE